MGVHLRRAWSPDKDETVRTFPCSASIAQLLPAIGIEVLASRFELPEAVRCHILQVDACLTTEKGHVPEQVGQPLLNLAPLLLRQHAPARSRSCCQQ